MTSSRIEKKLNRRVINLRWKKHSRIMVSVASSVLPNYRYAASSRKD